MTYYRAVGRKMSLKTRVPILKKRLFAIEDDGLIQRLDFSDCDDLEFPSDKFPSPVKRVSSPIRNHRNRSSVSPSDDEQLNSSSDSAMGDLSFISKTPAQRRLRKCCQKNNRDSTPPYRKVRALRLFGSPQSPKTLLKQSELPPSDIKSRTESSGFTPKLESYYHNCSVERIRKSKPMFSPLYEANINPFTQNLGLTGSQIKRRRDSGICRVSFNESYDSLDNDIDCGIHRNKRIHLNDGTASRYESEFYEVEQIGSGEFGSVFKCINRLDGCVYAIKRSRKPLKGTSDERTALNEVYAHAVLGHHKHVVRYFSAWAENDHMLIQNEYCNGGSLAQALEEKSSRNEHFPEIDVKQILLHIALGLRYIHSLNLVHMDIKPGNIFITRQENSLSSCDEFDDDDFGEETVVYKIGDLGHVTSAVNPEVEEGDCRYLPGELLQDNYKHLPKADIFALGMTIFEICGGGPLPKNGDSWHAIREGKLPYLSYYSKELNDLIRIMVDPDPERRPSSAALVYNSTLVPFACKTKEQLSNELKVEKLKNQLLARELEKAAKSLKMGTSINRISRLVGGKVNRSTSVTF